MMVQNLELYPYSGHRDYAVGRASAVLDLGKVLAMLGGRAWYRKFLQEGLKEGHREEHYEVVDQRFSNDRKPSKCFL
jgi:hypothetical protein